MCDDDDDDDDDDENKYGIRGVFRDWVAVPNVLHCLPPLTFISNLVPEYPPRILYYELVGRCK